MTRGNGIARVVKATIVVGALAMFTTGAQAQIVLYSDGLSFSAAAYGFSGSDAIGAQFQPSATALFQDAILVLGTGGAATGTISVYLYTDNGSNLPGTIIEGPISVSVTNIPAALAVYSSLHPLLLAGTSYWLVVADPSGYRWYETSSGVVNTSTDFALNLTFPSNTSWMNVFGGDKAPAYEVDGLTAATSGGPFQMRYVTNLNIADSAIDISNDGSAEAGTSGAITGGNGNLCIGVYSFDPTEELQSCCACLVTPDGLASISAKSINLTNLTGESPTSLVIKLLAWSGTTNATTSSTAPPGTPPTGNTCNAGTPGLALVPGMQAWGTTTHATPTGYTITETAFSPAVLSPAELAHITTACEFNQINGSGITGQCPGCTTGGQ